MERLHDPARVLIDRPAAIASTGSRFSGEERRMSIGDRQSVAVVLCGPLRKFEETGRDVASVSIVFCPQDLALG